MTGPKRVGNTRCIASRAGAARDRTEQDGPQPSNRRPATGGRPPVALADGRAGPPQPRLRRRPRAVGGSGRAVRSGGPFEEWFAAEFSAIHGADLKQKLMWPLVGKTWDWVKGEKNENVAPLFSLATHLLGE